MMSDPDHRVLLISCPDRPDHAWLLQLLRRTFGRRRLRTAVTVGEACRLIDEGHWAADLVVIRQAWPDEYTPGDVARLAAALPLARWVCCYEPWCASDGRRRSTWPEASRVPLARVAERLKREQAVLAGRSRPLPLTASRDETFRFDAAAPGPRGPHSPLVAIETPDRALADWLTEWLARCGHATVDHGATATVALVDIDPWNARTAERLARAGRDRTSVIALAGSPNRELSDELLTAGASHVVDKLAIASDLPAVLDGLR